MKKKKLFEYKVVKDKPYLIAKIKIKTSKLKIMPLADVHIGSSGFNEKKFLDYLKFIKEEPNVLCYLGGDIIELAIGDSPGGAIFEQTMRPKEQMLYAIDKLNQIKEKILFSEPGNHENRSIKRVDIDPLYWIMRAMGIENRHFNSPVIISLKFYKNWFNFYVQHGVTNARTHGGRINAAMKPTIFIKPIHFICMGHVHDAQQNPIMKYLWDFNKGKSILKRYLQYIIITPSFYRYWGTYAAKQGWQPSSEGAVVPILYKNGKYEVST